MGRRFYKLSEKLQVQSVFLEAIAAGEKAGVSAEIAGAGRRTFYRWRTEDTKFAAAWEQASAAPKNELEHEALRRAVKGVEKPVYRGGEIVGHITDYSDSMLMFLLKAHYPEKYGSKNSAQNTAAAQGATAEFEIEGARDALKRKFAEVTQPGKTQELF
tara:strand:+ start:1744 stop:2220 length:477 start_codon:yes stop_codon:yes gene_type:complete